MRTGTRREERSTDLFKQLNLHSFGAARRRQAILCLLLLASLGAASSDSAGQSQQPGTQQSGNAEFQAVGRGIEHLRITRGHKSENEASGPWLINLLRVDLKQVDLRIAHALDEGVGLETTSSLAARYRAIAAVNAGFFRTTGTYRGESSGVLVLDGKLISEPIDGRAAFGLIKKSRGTQLIFGHLKFSGDLGSVGGRRSTISGINRPRGADELIVYTPEFHRTTLTTPDGVELIARRNKVIRVRDGEGSSAIPLDGFVISACGRAREWVLANLRIGSLVRLDSKLVPLESDPTGSWKQASFIAGGGPQLIKEGSVVITFEEEKIAAKFVSDRHPRTAIARLKDGNMLIATVDGRQPGTSVGMSLFELASLLLEFGGLDGINLDGGGSTTMVVNGKLVNNPSDPPGERPVSDAMLILPRGLQSKHRMH
ncbi:MAG: phosphodiester glycosidase family protein [Acidobacteriota bacterium]